MGKPTNLNQLAKDYLDAHIEKRRANEQLHDATRLEREMHEVLEKAEDALTNCVGDNIRRRAIHVDGVTVLIEYTPEPESTCVSVFECRR